MVPDTGFVGVPDTGVVAPDTGVVAPDTGFVGVPDTGVVAPDTGAVVTPVAGTRVVSTMSKRNSSTSHPHLPSAILTSCSFRTSLNIENDTLW